MRFPTLSLVTLIAIALALVGCATQGIPPGEAEADEVWTGPNHVVAVADEADFDRRMAEAEGLVLVEFHAIRRCATCQIMEPSVQRLAFEHLDGLTVLTVDVDDLLPLTRREGVQGIPTFLLYRGGEVIRRSQGMHTHADLEALLTATP